MSGYLSQNANRISSKNILDSTVCQNLEPTFNIILVMNVIFKAKCLIQSSNALKIFQKFWSKIGRLEGLILKIQKIGGFDTFCCYDNKY